MIQILYFRNNNTVKKDKNRHGGNPPICRRGFTRKRSIANTLTTISRFCGLL